MAGDTAHPAGDLMVAGPGRRRPRRLASGRQAAASRLPRHGLRSRSSDCRAYMNGGRGMAYGHAERNLVLLRQLEAETRQLLESLDQPDPEQSAWLQEVTSKADGR